MKSLRTFNPKTTKSSALTVEKEFENKRSPFSFDPALLNFLPYTVDEGIVNAHCSVLSFYPDGVRAAATYSSPWI